MTQGSEAGADAPLAGIVVADFSRVLAGPYCSMLLADLGADVIKIEGPGGDDTRTWRPPEAGGTSTYFLSVNRNKRSIALDLSDPDDLAIAGEIIARSDVVLENFRSETTARFGLDATTLRRARPGLVVATISGFGPESSLPGYDLVVQALSGLMDVTGDADGPATKVGVAIVDVLAGLHAAIGILAALLARTRSGDGDAVSVNLLASALSGLVNQSGAYAAAGVVPHRRGNEHPSLTPYAPYAAADADVVVAVGNDAQFVRLCAALDCPALATDPRFDTMPHRNAHRDALRPLLEARLRARPAAGWVDLLRAAGIPAAPVTDIEGGFRFAEEIGLRPIVTSGEGDRTVRTVRTPIGFADAAIDYRLPPPTLDEHRGDIVSWIAQTSPR